MGVMNCKEGVLAAGVRFLCGRKSPTARYMEKDGGVDTDAHHCHGNAFQLWRPRCRRRGCRLEKNKNVMQAMCHSSLYCHGTGD